MLISKPVVAILAASISYSTALDANRGQEFTIRSAYQPRIVSKPSPNKYTTNAINLEISTTGISQSSAYLNAIRAGNHIDGVYSRLQTPSNTSLLAVQGGSVFLAPLRAGNQSFNVVIDTGSADTWLISTSFTCLDPSTSHTVAESVCAFGPSYTLSPTAIEIPSENFNISYADGEFLNGALYTENVTFAGVSVSQQELAVVDYAAWRGDTLSSGLVGLAYPLLTNAYAGANPANDDKTAYLPYNPLFTTMYTRNLTPPVFSLALQRASPTTLSAAGGVLAVGGIPQIPHSAVFYSTPIAVTGIDSVTGANEYMFYTIDITGWAMSADAGVIFDTLGTGNTRYTPLVAPAAGTSVIVDSGTTLLYAPDEVVTELAGLFSPKATYDSQREQWMVDCGARAPVFGVVIAKKVFYVNRADLVLPVGGGSCIMGVQAQSGGLTILGDVWMRNVLVVFDVGAAEVRVAARQFTGASV